MLKIAFWCLVAVDLLGILTLFILGLAAAGSTRTNPLQVALLLLVIPSIPLAISASNAETDPTFTTGSGAAAVARPGKIKTFNIGSTYDFGVAKVFGIVSRSTDERDPLNIFTRTPDLDLTGYLLGVSVPVGAGVIRASYARVKYDFNRQDLFGLTTADPKADKFALGYVHNLSKRTALYGTIARVSNKNGANLTIGAGPSYLSSANGVALRPKNSTGYEFGVRHTF